MMAIILSSPNVNSLLFSSILTFTLIFISATNGAIVDQQGFTLNLIHRDSPLSPLHNPSLDKYESLGKSIHRSIARVNRLGQPTSVSPNDVVSTVIPARGEYVMEVSIGTPPVRQFGIVDTGSDLIWTQCQPCVNCYEQVVPIFDPRNSSSFKAQSCTSKACRDLSPDQRMCSTTRDICGYSYSYGDQSHTIGDVALETLTFQSVTGRPTSLLNVTFGCGHDNTGTFRKEGSSLIGLGGGPLSLPSQISSSIGGKFSYCLIPFTQGNSTSKINFGTKGVVSGPGVVSTPIVQGEIPTFYTLTLESISVGTKRIPFYNRKRSSVSSTDDYGSSSGNIVIDSGTTLTFLPEELFTDLVSALTQAIKGRQVDDPTGALVLCYQASRDLIIPDVTAHFTGADVVLKPDNTFIEVAKGVVCLAALQSDEVGTAIFGNIAQINYLVGYDTEERTVSFKPTDCTRVQ